MSDIKINSLPINTGIALNKSPKAKSLETTKPIDDRQYIPAQYKEVAASMEQQFTEMMLEQMNRSIGETESGESDVGMGYYKSLQQTEHAKAMTAQNNLGLQDLILDQVYPKRMRNEMALKQYEAQANRIHHNLPSYKIDRKTDTIQMGKNDSTSVSDGKAPVGTKEDGGLL